jgi:hypothetical protein
MALRKMTFEIPDEVAERFISEVPASEQSGVVTKLLQRRVSRPRLTEEEWAAVCEAANADDQLNADIDEWQGFSDSIEEPWNAPSPR